MICAKKWLDKTCCGYWFRVFAHFLPFKHQICDKNILKFITKFKKEK